MKIKLESVLTFFYALDSIFLAIYIFFIKDFIYPPFIKKIILEKLNPKYIKLLLPYKVCILGLIYFLILLGISYVLLKVTFKVSNKYSISENTVEEIESATDSFLPSYLGYFFVALSISEIEVFIVIFLLIFIFTYRSKLSHFNPMFLVLGYRYYYYKIDGVKNLLITRRKIKRPKELSIDTLFRINDFTYIEI